MGIQGTEVAKESSDIIILDDNFASVVKVYKYFFFKLILASATNCKHLIMLTFTFLSTRLSDGDALFMQTFKNSFNSRLQ